MKAAGWILFAVAGAFMWRISMFPATRTEQPPIAFVLGWIGCLLAGLLLFLMHDNRGGRNSISVRPNRFREIALLAEAGLTVAAVLCILLGFCFHAPLQGIGVIIISSLGLLSRVVVLFLNQAN